MIVLITFSRQKNHIHLMFDNQHGVSGIHQPIQDIQKVLNIPDSTGLCG
jgi:hypothetical protein